MLLRFTSELVQVRHNNFGWRREEMNTPKGCPECPWSVCKSKAMDDDLKT